MVKFEIRSEHRKGAECMFFIRNNIGYKLYSGRSEAIQALRRQRFFYKLGIAPRPYKLVRIRIMYSNFHRRFLRYGYTTELAKDCGMVKPEHYNYINNVLTRNKVYWADMHPLNMGFVNNKPVIVDFGDFFYDLEGTASLIF